MKNFHNYYYLNTLCRCCFFLLYSSLILSLINGETSLLWHNFFLVFHNNFLSVYLEAWTFLLSLREDSRECADSVESFRDNETDTAWRTTDNGFSATLKNNYVDSEIYF